jgi:hypothetical protein
VENIDKMTGVANEIRQSLRTSRQP